MIGFIAGLKIADYLFYSEKNLIIIQQDTEQKYWKKFGEPINLEYDLVPCEDPSLEGKKCKTWIKIKIPKDKYLPRIDEKKFKKFKNN